MRAAQLVATCPASRATTQIQLKLRFLHLLLARFPSSSTSSSTSSSGRTRAVCFTHRVHPRSLTSADRRDDPRFHSGPIALRISMGHPLVSPVLARETITRAYKINGETLPLARSERILFVSAIAIQRTRYDRSWQIDHRV